MGSLTYTYNPTNGVGSRLSHTTNNPDTIKVRTSATGSITSRETITTRIFTRPPLLPQTEPASAATTWFHYDACWQSGLRDRSPRLKLRRLHVTRLIPITIVGTVNGGSENRLAGRRNSITTTASISPGFFGPIRRPRQKYMTASTGSLLIRCLRSKG